MLLPSWPPQWIVRIMWIWRRMQYEDAIITINMEIDSAL
jgi:hypothetical protein